MTFIPFLLAALVLAITPGPGIAYVVARTVADDRVTLTVTPAVLQIAMPEVPLQIFVQFFCGTTMLPDITFEPLDLFRQSVNLALDRTNRC